MIKNENQKRHEQLIDFISKFSQYQDLEGKPRLNKVKKAIPVRELEYINTFDINNAVVVFTDVLNINSGSVGDVDMYRLLQAYLTIPECRAKINVVVNEAHSKNYKRYEKPFEDDGAYADDDID